MLSTEKLEEAMSIAKIKTCQVQTQRGIFPIGGGIVDADGIRHAVKLIHYESRLQAVKYLRETYNLSLKEAVSMTDMALIVWAMQLNKEI